MWHDVEESEWALQNVELLVWVLICNSLSFYSRPTGAFLGGNVEPVPLEGRRPEPPLEGRSPVRTLGREVGPRRATKDCTFACGRDGGRKPTSQSPAAPAPLKGSLWLGGNFRPGRPLSAGSRSRGHYTFAPNSANLHFALPDRRRQMPLSTPVPRPAAATPYPPSNPRGRFPKEGAADPLLCVVREGVQREPHRKGSLWWLFRPIKRPLSRQ